MPHEERCYCIGCETLVHDGFRKYAVAGSTLLCVYTAATTGKRVDLSDYVCGSCGRRFDLWRESMNGDFDHLDVSMEDEVTQERELSSVSSKLDFDLRPFCSFFQQSMEVDTADATVSMVSDIEKDDETEVDDQASSVKLSIRRTSKSHRYVV